MIFHITTREEWEKAKMKGEYRASSLDTDGFIHCSALKQTVETANLFFKGRKGLVLLCIDENRLESECRYEDPAAGGHGKRDPREDNLFPHIYGPVNNSAVIRVADFPSDERGLFHLPGEL